MYELPTHLVPYSRMPYAGVKHAFVRKMLSSGMNRLRGAFGGNAARSVPRPTPPMARGPQALPPRGGTSPTIGPRGASPPPKAPEITIEPPTSKAFNNARPKPAAQPTRPTPGTNLPAKAPPSNLPVASSPVARGSARNLARNAAAAGAGSAGLSVVRDMGDPSMSAGRVVKRALGAGVVGAAAGGAGGALASRYGGQFTGSAGRALRAGSTAGAGLIGGSYGRSLF